ncbi:hypothetical protein C8Q73DRAFT_658434 [Cubamyces lactineus]|nr:hypothetical protein C8Q73DRAFT_658434 [Cubamyces lactineus]
MLPTAPHSAPANIVFNTQAIPISPGELDFNELHIPSPFLGPHNNAGSASQIAGTSSQHTSGPRASAPSGKRRNTSSSGDESSVASKPARKRQSPAIRAPSIGPSSRRGSVRNTRSANSTPLFPAPSTSARPSPAQRSIQGPSDVPGDTPSPVDPPMPPPVHPASYTPPIITSNTPTTTAASSPPLPPTPASPATAAPPSQITPVTPASMLKLGRLAVSSALTPQPGGQEDATVHKGKEGKTSGRSSRAKAADKAAAAPLTSPGLKPIRPAGNAVMTPIATSPTAPFNQPMHVRKTSHKAAEQKRRDSLKTSFDDLRVLLPPIPLPSDEGFQGDLLPGEMPPRGPPKGNAEGPNRGVSKLQLLRCGNEFIKILKGRVERRDEEITKLRQEVRRLRDLVGEDAAMPSEEGQEMLDLERDLDACEISTSRIFGRARALSVTEGDGEEEGDY